jgi:hypothetical protein
MILKLKTGTVIELKRGAFFLVVMLLVVWAALAVVESSDRYEHDHVYKVAEVLECLATGYDVNCRVTTTDGDEVLTDAWALVGSKLYQRCYIKEIEVSDQEPDADEWCYNTYIVGSPNPRPGHDHEWKRYKNR